MEFTYFKINKDEVRPIGLKIRDENEDLYEITDGTVEILDEEGDAVVAEQVAYTAQGIIGTVVGTLVTSVPGVYYIKWKVRRNVAGTIYTFYHKTHLTVEDL